MPNVVHTNKKINSIKHTELCTLCVMIDVCNRSDFTYVKLIILFDGTQDVA